MNDFLNSFSNIPANIIASFSQINMTLDLAIKLVAAYFFIIWCAFIIWTVKDITARSGNILVQVFCILIVIVLTPVLGLPIYLLIRPANKYQNEGQGEILQEAFVCPKCGEEVEEDFFFCPHCRAELLFKCEKCGKLCESTWSACPYCGKEKAGEKDEKTPLKKKAPPAEENQEKKIPIEEVKSEEIKTEVVSDPALDVLENEG